MVNHNYIAILIFENKCLLNNYMNLKSEKIIVLKIVLKKKLMIINPKMKSSIKYKNFWLIKQKLQFP